jgi:aminoglycoside phosphotransferase family enzyme
MAASVASSSVLSVDGATSILDTQELRESVAALKLRATYPEAPSAVAAIETHFAWIFLAGDYAYKLKKPLRNALTDLSTLEARRMSCLQDLPLNRRLASDVYLDVVPLARAADGALRIAGDGVVVEWLIRMRRLPAALMLDRAIAAGTASPEALISVGAMLARFYLDQPRVEFEPDAYVERIAGQIRADRQALFAPELQLDERHVQCTLDATWSAFATSENELADRAREHRIVEGHGDLRPEHICLSEPPCVIDALELSRDLRVLDPAEELAFLCLECARAGGAQAGWRVVESYRRESLDPVTDRLLNFYQSRRAIVRAKLMAWHLCDRSVMNLGPWRELAEEYLALAQHYARQVTG